MHKYNFKVGTLNSASEESFSVLALENQDKNWATKSENLYLLILEHT